MSLKTNLENAFVRVATEFKALRTLINGNAADLSALTTTQKANLVSAINELDAAVTAAAESGGATNLDQLTDVTLSALTEGHLLRYDGAGQFVNVDPGQYFIPHNAILADIMALNTADYGLALLELTDQAALMALLLQASEAAAGLIEIATQAEVDAGTDNERAVTPLRLKTRIDAAIAALVDTAPGTLDTLNELAAALGDDPNFAATVTSQIAGKQDGDATLTALANLTTSADQMVYSTGIDAFSMTTLTTFARSLLDDADAAAARATLSVYSQAEIGNPETDFVAVFNAALA